MLVNIKFKYFLTNKNVDIIFNPHDAFLEKSSSGGAEDWKIGKENNLKF
jgi:hypothetical protein